MIQYIKRSELDIKKYDLCIKNSINSRVYAFSWYLDIVADNWDALILNDYDAVMPLPWKTKYYIKYIYTPCWTQQLGVFSSDEISEELVEKFLKKFPNKFLKTALNLNSHNAISGKNIVSKKNYILLLNKPYQELFKGYKYVRRRCKNLLNTDRVNIIKTDNFQDVIRLFIQQKQEEIDLKLIDYNRLENLIKLLKKTEDSVDIVIAKNREGVLLGGAFFIKNSKRITYLFSSISQEGRDEQVMTYIIDSIIEKHAKSNLILDFEGSMIPGIAFFFRSFGAREEIYFSFQKRLIF
ncbi:MAG: hypothetical protein L3J14_09585 [Flavobacteriaceae bacterium]|nr:hypothetical protein [Flavobacteriaceae bacterium]